MSQNKAAWVKRAEKELRGTSLDGLAWQIPEGHDVQAVCAAENGNVFFGNFVFGRSILPLTAEH